MKKFLRTFVSVMLVLTLLLSVTACKKGPKDPTDPTDPSEGQQAELVVSSALGLDLYERKELVARDKNGAVVAATWTVADATIATVSANGLVSAMKDGKTTVTATYGEHTADCEVTVRDSGERPSMSIVSDKKVTVVGGKTSVTPVCTYKNEDMPFQMTVSGGNDEVVTYVVEDGTITFTGVAIGSTSVEISGTCGNYTLTPITLPIEIVDSTSIVYADGNLTLSTLNDPENGWIASHPVEISVYDGEQLRSPRMTRKAVAWLRQAKKALQPCAQTTVKFTSNLP